MTGYVIFPHAGTDTTSSTPWLRIIDALDRGGHRPALWLGAHRVATVAARRFPDCTFLSGKLLRSSRMEDVVRGLAPLRVDRGVGPSCLDHLGPHAYESLKLRAAAMLGRTSGWPGPDRLRSRLAVVSVMVDSFWRHLKQNRPSGVISAETPFSAPTYIIWELAGALGIPRVAFENVKQAPLVFSRTEIAGRPNDGPAMSSEHDVLRERIIDAVVAEFVAADDRRPQYVQDNRNREGAHDLRRDTRFDTSVMRRALRTLRISTERHRTRTGHRPRPREAFRLIVESVRRARRRVGVARAERLARDHLTASWTMMRSSTPDGPHALFALGYEHEKNVLPDGDVNWHQTDVALRLRSELPAEVGLVVREHPTMFYASAGGHRGRTPEEYELLAAVPGVILADDRALIDAIRGASLVCAVKGMAPFWGLAVGRPGLVFTEPWYAELPGIVRYRMSGDAVTALESGTPPLDAVVEAMRETLRRMTFVGINSPEFRDRYRAWEPVFPAIEDLAVAGISSVVSDVLRVAPEGPGRTATVLRHP